MARLNKAWQVGEGDPALATELHRVLEVSHRQAKGLIDSACVKLNGELVQKYGVRLKVGDQLAISFDPDTAYQTLPPARKQLDKAGFKILWEDKHVLFVDKPAGLLTVPSEKGTEACLAEAITDHYRRRGIKRFHLFIVHRLDRYSSGLLVFAKTPEALHGLKTLFEAHHIHRIYKAILVGELPENTGILTGKLVEHAKSLKMSVVQPKKGDVKGAKHAITHYRVLERLPGHTVVEVKLETGRRNQIRVQFADRGFPLLGDQVYGETSELIDRQALHAELLGFRHPITDEAVSVIAPMPKDMENALKALRTHRRVERAEAGIQGEEGIFKPKITKGRKFERVLRAGRYTQDGSERETGRDDSRGAGPEDDRPRRFGSLDREERPRREGTDARPARSSAPDRTSRPSTTDRTGGRSSAKPGERERGPARSGDRSRPSGTGPRSSASKPRTSSAGPRSESSKPRTASSGPRSSSASPRAARVPVKTRKPK